MISKRKLELWVGSNRWRRAWAAATWTEEEGRLLSNLRSSSPTLSRTSGGDEDSDDERRINSSRRGARSRSRLGALIVFGTRDCHCLPRQRQLDEDSRSKREIVVGSKVGAMFGCDFFLRRSLSSDHFRLKYPPHGGAPIELDEEFETGDVWRMDSVVELIGVDVEGNIDQEAELHGEIPNNISIVKVDFDDDIDRGVISQRVFIVSVVDHSYLVTLLLLWPTTSSYPSTTLAVFAMRRAFAGRGCRPYLRQVGCTTTGAPHTCIRPVARVGSATSAGQLSEGMMTWRPGQRLSYQVFCVGLHADSIGSGAKNLVWSLA
ncbi:hypothetical protein GW17_00000467 [Ensete ventricosum]|nr:hypothetical protein GW17_00000467 [Ensete ventricosum]